MSDFKLRAPPRLRLSALMSISGVIGQGAAVPLAGSALASAQAAAALLRGVNLGGAASASAQATAALLRGIRMQGAAVAGSTSAASLGWAVAPVITFVQGGGETFNVAATGPAGYTAGGVYGVDPLNTALPTLITLSEGGVLSDGGSAVTSANSIRFTYFEPGALPTLTLHPTVTATLPYHATVYPVEGAVPSGQILVSPDDANLRSSVLSTWPDGSAQVMVVAGETAVTNAVTKAIRLRPGAPSGTALTASRIDAIVSDIVVNFGGGDQTLSDFTSPARTWWANSATICCRYVLGCGLGTMKAIIDIHAFKAGVSDRAFVEVVIENGEVNANAATVTAPSTQTYTGATVKVNGATIATVSSPGAGSDIPNCRRYDEGYSAVKYTGGHEPFRAWYCSTWVGLDPGMEVTHDIAYLQGAPLFYQPAEASTENLATKYAETWDTYVPWATCRLRAPAMDGTGDDEEIGPWTECQSDYLASGNLYARRAVLATGLAALSLNWHFRHADGTPPTRAQVLGKNTTNGNWPALTTEPRYGPNSNDASHIPAVALVPFLCRPSPCFIDMAQKEFAWHHSNFGSTDGSHSFDQVRSRAWRARAYASTILLTPDADATRKADYRTALATNIAVNNAFLDAPYNSLAVVWGLTANTSNADHDGRARCQHAPWMQHFCLVAWNFVDAAKVLRDADGAAWSAMTDKACAYVVRRINEATGGEWRYHPYTLTIGDITGGTINMGSGDWGAMTRSDMTGTLPPASGSWITGTPTDWSGVSADSAAAVSAGTSYPAQMWAALCAAIERDVPGSDSAWDKVITNGGISDFAAWRTGFRTAPRFNRWPRNK
jgi:hypothetical protein